MARTPGSPRPMTPMSQRRVPPLRERKQTQRSTYKLRNSAKEVDSKTISYPTPVATPPAASTPSPVALPPIKPPVFTDNKPLSSTSKTPHQSPYALRSAGPVPPPPSPDDSSSRYSLRPRYSLRSTTAKHRPAVPVPTVECLACSDSISIRRCITLPSCGHIYCRSCLKSLIMLSTVDEAMYPPRCCSTIPSTSIRNALTKHEYYLYRLGEREWSTPAPERFYCAKPSCGKFIPLPKGVSSSTGWGRVVCRRCKGGTCTGCKKEFHFETDCSGDSGLEKVLGIADKEKWRRCFKCMNIVERTAGCNHMTCRCGASFCYSCGLKYGTCKPYYNVGTGQYQGCVPR